MNRATRILITGLALIVLAVGAGAGVASYMISNDLGGGSDPPPPTPRVPERIFATGLVETVEGEIDVMAQLPGELSEVNVTEGDRVEKGDLLAVIDARRQKAAVDVAEANRAVSKAKLESVVAARDADAASPPMHAAVDPSTSSAAAQPHAPTDEDVEIARAAVELAEKQLDEAKTNYDYRRVVAPTSGIVLKVYRHAGDSVQPGSPTPVVQIADTSRLRIRLEVDETEVEKLEAGMEGSFTIRSSSQNVGRLAVERVIPAFGPQRLFNPDTSARVDTRATELLCKVISTDVTLFAGQRITAEFEIDEDDDADRDEASDDDEDESEEALADADDRSDETEKADDSAEVREEEAALKDVIRVRRRLADAHPGEKEYRERLALAHGRLGYFYIEQKKTEKAEDELARAIELDGDTRYPWYLPALVRAAVADEKGYRAACRTVLDCFEKSDEREVLNQVAWTCAIGPDVIDDYRRVVKLTDRTMAGVDEPMHHLQNTRGAVLYRAGRFDDAAEQLEEAVADHWKGGTPWDWFFLAMAHHQLGNADDAHDWLDKAVEWMDEDDSESGEEEGRPELGWDQKLELEILRQEAEALLTVRRA
ncbi:MAG TPA: biotin/lipoyl-binding protein [Thermoguttaceae bacterium]|nr:biotin/lipoyl-binding protein [Thermoguttaceae bacterium]